MRHKAPAVAHWVRCTICIIAAAGVPGMLVALYFGADPSVGVASAIGLFAICCARLAFNDQRESNRKTNESHKTSISIPTTLPGSEEVSEEKAEHCPQL
jgi:hypothetical protein